jgi:hypothetical protein
VTDYGQVTRDEQRARNEALFRSVNERLKQIDDRLDTAAVGAPVQEREEFFCECGSLGCSARLAMTREQYEWVREHPTYFVVLEGHVDERIERVVERHPPFAVVEKSAEEEEIARETDPRSDDS